ncbi:hypothetical protein [Corallococcus caeni]|uniref:PDZ domain-containing protein n=1 Tax=Corallococcus caeni TaxID=3082388 RepID=A0ABQ6QRJ5_9BACT|nr:hypothetical protein ASNO1_28940 [Corallococcus sp. NO1]
MFLASLLSVFAGAWLLAAAPFTVTMKSAGYSARSDGKTVTVTRVEPRSVAAEAGLQKGMKVTGIFMPIRAFIKVPLPQLNATDLQDALTPQPAESLGLQVETKRGPEQLILQSRDPLPANPFPVIPLTQAQQERLTMVQANLYQVRLMQALMEQQQGPPLKVRQETTAYVMQGKLVGVEGGGATPLWLHPSISLEARCRDGLEKLEVSGAAKDVNLTLKPEDARYAGGSSFELVPALWKAPQVVQQCAGVPKPLEQSLHLKLTCKGKPPVEQDAAVKLAVRCGEPAPVTRRLMFLREPWDFMVGDKTPLQVDVGTGMIIPRPSEVAVVELDADGKVTRRLASVPIAKNTHDSTVHVPLDTTVARTVKLAVEVRYADGSTWLTEPDTREVRSQEQLDALKRKVTESRAKMDAFEKRFAAKFNDPCADLPATMKWLQAQPDLEYASAAESGHSFSYKVKDTLAPLVFSCH